MKKIFVMVTVLAFAACTKLITPTQPDADRAAVNWPGTTLTELEQGQILYKNNCGKCHGLKKPTSRTEAEWREIVPKMAKKAKIDKQKEELVLKYVVTMSSAL